MSALPLLYLNALLPIAGGMALVLYGHQWRARQPAAPIESLA